MQVAPGDRLVPEKRGRVDSPTMKLSQAVGPCPADRPLEGELPPRHPDVPPPLQLEDRRCKSLEAHAISDFIETQVLRFLKDALMLAVRSKEVVDAAVVAVEREMSADLVGRSRDDVVLMQIGVGYEVANAAPTDIEIRVRPEIISPQVLVENHTEGRFKVTDFVGGFDCYGHPEPLSRQRSEMLKAHG